MIDTVIAITVVLGGPGYLIAAIMVLGLRVWLSNRVSRDARARWIRIVLNSLLLLLAALCTVYAVTFLNALLPSSSLRRDWTRITLAIVLSILPYCIVLPLGGWWLGVWSDPPARETPVALTPQVTPEKEE